MWLNSPFCKKLLIETSETLRLLDAAEVVRKEASRREPEGDWRPGSADGGCCTATTELLRSSRVGMRSNVGHIGLLAGGVRCEPSLAKAAGDSRNEVMEGD